MGLPLSLALALIAATVLFYVSIRNAWIAWQLALHSTFASYWARRTRQGAVVLDEALAVWPYWTIIRHPSWSWRSFVVRQDYYDEMSAFVRTEVQRSDLNWETYLAELHADQAPAEQAPEAATATAASTSTSTTDTTTSTTNTPAQ